MSSHNGDKAYCLSRDHRPNDEKEYQRIIEAGGKIYQTEANIKNKEEGTTENITGPLRVIPGKLSISRAIGDIEAKHPDLGGNPNVIIALPEIKYFDINPNNDFILIGCDGLFDKMKNKEIIDFMWKNNNARTKDIHNMCGILVERLVKESIIKKSTDNITAIFISLKDNLIGVESKVAMTHQVDKISKRILTEENKISQIPSTKSIISKITKFNKNTTTEKYIPINK
jgi:protein phosphatase 2C family protein 2/3